MTLCSCGEAVYAAVTAAGGAGEFGIGVADGVGSSSGSGMSAAVGDAQAGDSIGGSLLTAAATSGDASPSTLFIGNTFG